MNKKRKKKMDPPFFPFSVCVTKSYLDKIVFFFLPQVIRYDSCLPIVHCGECKQSKESLTQGSKIGRIGFAVECFPNKSEDNFCQLKCFFVQKIINASRTMLLIAGRDCKSVFKTMFKLLKYLISLSFELIRVLLYLFNWNFFLFYLTYIIFFLFYLTYITFSFFFYLRFNFTLFQLPESS